MFLTAARRLIHLARLKSALQRKDIKMKISNSNGPANIAESMDSKNISKDEQRMRQAIFGIENKGSYNDYQTSIENNNVNNVHVQSNNILPKGITFRMTPSLKMHMNELKELYTAIQKNHPDWDQSRIVSELRKVDYGSNDGRIWDMAMPFNRGNSNLSAAEQFDFQRIRQDMIQQDDLDIGHVLVAMDVQQSFDTITDSHASWAGDLGTAVLDAHASGSNVQLGTNSASTADLLADVDGVNIAKHMESGHEMEALFNYYLGNGEHCEGATIKERFSTFSADQDLLTDKGEMKTNAAEIIDDDITSFIYKNNLISNINGLFDGRLPGGEFIPTSDIPNLVDQSAEQFIDILEQGMRLEN